MAPAWRSDSMFPGSRYAMLIKNPGPVYAQSFLKLNPVYGKIIIVTYYPTWLIARSAV